MANDPLAGRSVRTLAWLGDAAFEDHVRRAVAQRGDWPVDRLDAVKARIVNAGAQAELLEAIEPALDESERAIVQRGRNASVRSGGRVQRDVRSYRAATGFEALFAHWTLANAQDRIALIGAPLANAIDAAFAATERPKRG